MDLTLKARESGLGYWVRSGERVVGTVRQVESYGVRGKRKHWEAYRLGKPIGRANTRRDAVSLLDRSFKKTAA